MPSIHAQRRRNRRFPSWFLCGLVGIVASCFVALADWMLVETNVLQREQLWLPDFSLGGVDEVAVNIYKQHHLSTSAVRDVQYAKRQYGLPFRGWGTVLAQPSIAGGRARCQAVVAVDICNIWPSQNGPAGCFDRFLPVCPLILPLVFDAAFWGAACWGVVVVSRRMRKSGDIPCEECGYNLAGLPKDSQCPECGEHR